MDLDELSYWGEAVSAYNRAVEAASKR